MSKKAGLVALLIISSICIIACEKKDAASAPVLEEAIQEQANEEPVAGGEESGAVLEEKVREQIPAEE
jgi:hypothetical protein